jgi:Zn-dependent M28 family amino/carboxypeptidase
VVDHDSLWAFNNVVRPAGAESDVREATADESVRIKAILDSLRKTRKPRLDSIRNGADDDGSGTVTVLAVADAMLKSKVKPKRSIIFVWHTGEEKGLWGSKYFTENPTVPRDSIVAQLNLDMVGRGGAHDMVVGQPGTVGGPNYLQLVGSRRLSTELGDLVEEVNTRDKFGFTFDYTFDGDGHPANIYCRSDHYMYARWGIPVVFFTTGVHQDYHESTDEVEYIDFPKMARIATFVANVALNVANADHRLVVDKPKPDPQGQCKQ